MRDSPVRADVQHRLDEYLKRLDERDIEQARDYSRQFPTQFATRIERYQDYLKMHQTGGHFISEAMEAKDRVLREWDDYAYRQAYDHATAHPDDVAEVAHRLRDYLRDQPEGRHAADAQHYLDWWDKVSVPGQYHVTLRRGEVEPAVGKYLAGGAPDLGVVIEVAGSVYGPSSVIPRLAPADLGLHVSPADHLEAGRSDHDPDHRLRLVGQRGLCAPQPAGRPAGDATAFRNHQADQGWTNDPGICLRLQRSHLEPA